jgi:hypothetical protein
MKERPILFSGGMVRAILDGSKTQTRRVVKHSGDMEFDPQDPHYGPYWLAYVAGDAMGEDAKVRCPYGTPCDRLWVRETWQAIHVSIDPETGHGDDVHYAAKIPTSDEVGWWGIAYAATDLQADYCVEDRGFPWRPSIYMPRWASRILLEITDVRVQRLQEISDEDARAEGIKELALQADEPGAWWTAAPDRRFHSRTPRGAFLRLWRKIHGDGSWDANPWVWAITFRRLEP